MPNEGDGPTPWWQRGLPRTRRGLIAFISLQWTVVLLGVGGLIVLTLPEGLDQVFRKVLVPAGLALLFMIVVLFLIFPVPYLPGRIRKRVLQRRFPKAIVLSMPLSVWNRDAIRQLLGATPWPPRLTMTTAMVADSYGIGVWSGIRPARQLVTVPWLDIAKIGVSEREYYGRKFGALKLTRTDAMPELYFSVLSRRWFGITMYRHNELERLASRLETLRGAVAGAV